MNKSIHKYTTATRHFVSPDQSHSRGSFFYPQVLSFYNHNLLNLNYSICLAMFMTISNHVTFSENK